MAAAFHRYEGVVALVLPFHLIAFILLIFNFTELDVSITDGYFDWEAGTWPLRHNFWTSKVMHVRARDLIFIIGCSALFLAIGSLFSQRLLKLRRQAIFVVLAISFSTGIVALIKSYSPVPSPWDSIRYGGLIPHLSPFAHYPSDVPLGQCFPGAHAAGAFALMSGYYVLREYRLGWAWVALGLGAAMGCAYGAVQVARGAHYWSHNLWSAGIVWAICSTLYWGLFRGKLRMPVARPEKWPEADGHSPPR